MELSRFQDAFQRALCNLLYLERLEDRMMMATPCSIFHALIMKRTLRILGREPLCLETVADEKNPSLVNQRVGWLGA